MILMRSRQIFGGADILIENSVVAFGNHTNNLSDGADEIQAKLLDLDSSDPMSKPTSAAQICVVRRQGGGSTVSILNEYMSSYKLA